jgi:hypothetical protein
MPAASVTIFEDRGEYIGVVFTEVANVIVGCLNTDDPQPVEICGGYEWRTSDLTRFTIVTIKLQQLGIVVTRHPFESIFSKVSLTPSWVEVSVPMDVSNRMRSILNWSMNHPLDYFVVWTHDREESMTFAVMYLLNQLPKPIYVLCGHQTTYAWYRVWRKLTGRHTCDIKIIHPSDETGEMSKNSVGIVDFDSYSVPGSFYNKYNPDRGFFGTTVILSHQSRKVDEFKSQIKNTYPQTNTSLDCLNNWEIHMLERRLLSTPEQLQVQPTPSFVPIPVNLTPQQQRDASKLKIALNKATNSKTTKMRQLALDTFVSRCVISNAKNEIISATGADAPAIVTNKQIEKWASKHGIPNSSTGFDKALIGFKKLHPDSHGHVFVNNTVWYTSNNI